MNKGVIMHDRSSDLYYTGSSWGDSIIYARIFTDYNELFLTYQGMTSHESLLKRHGVNIQNVEFVQVHIQPEANWQNINIAFNAFRDEAIL